MRPSDRSNAPDPSSTTNTESEPRSPTKELFLLNLPHLEILHRRRSSCVSGLRTMIETRDDLCGGGEGGGLESGQGDSCSSVLQWLSLHTTAAGTKHGAGTSFPTPNEPLLRDGFPHAIWQLEEAESGCRAVKDHVEATAEFYDGGCCTRWVLRLPAGLGHQHEASLCTELPNRPPHVAATSRYWTHGGSNDEHDTCKFCTHPESGAQLAESRARNLFLV